MELGACVCEAGSSSEGTGGLITCCPLSATYTGSARPCTPASVRSDRFRTHRRRPSMAAPIPSSGEMPPCAESASLHPGCGS